MYNIGARTSKETTWTTQFTPFSLRWGGRFPVFPFVLPWWPTPIHTSPSNHHHEAEAQQRTHTHTLVSSKRPRENERKETAAAEASSSSRRPKKWSRR
ncbi:hypothetical protein L3X38_021356 [Prunus dulcis]|uniref:Uncharacterized protein n=1 Tax=Prunus dulcis TaxID=3755 RepID=A0AAD4VTW9_PRUDU|nr:hypothetical protein L3X38_021356 [Prunus dulcis]